jgi:lantibiotic biosynthesis protein
LMELYEVTGENNFKWAAEEGVAYERSHFNERQQNWPDFRQFDHVSPPSEDICSCAWCHGAPGIGLSRLRAFEITGDQEYRKEALIALNTTRVSNHLTSLSNFSLCHGLCGNSDLLIEASRVLSDDELLAEAEKIGVIGIENYLDKSIPFPNGLNNNFENPELMTGLAGIGYFYLRLFDAKKTPSVLNLFVGARN